VRPVDGPTDLGPRHPRGHSPVSGCRRPGVHRAAGATGAIWGSEPIGSLPRVTLARVLGALGRLLMSAGVILLLFVAYELWGTGIQAAEDQDQLEEEFEALQAAVGASTTSLPETTTTTAPTTETQPPETAPSLEESGLPVPEPGDVLGRIRIPTIGVDWIVQEGIPLRLLNRGPGHFPATPFPGQAGYSAIAGHRTTYGAPFNRLDELQAGDEIEVETLQGTFRYEVIDQPPDDEGVTKAHAIVRPWETELVEDIGGQDLITLVACHPEYSARQRIVVQGKLVGEPAATTPASEKIEDEPNAFFGSELEGGDSDAWPGAIAFGAAALAVWFLAWLVARRWSWREWRPWATYVALTPVFLVLLFFTFEHVNRLLPAAY
jgi:sortase A